MIDPDDDGFDPAVHFILGAVVLLVIVGAAASLALAGYLIINLL